MLKSIACEAGILKVGNVRIEIRNEFKYLKNNNKKVKWRGIDMVMDFGNDNRYYWLIV